MHEIKELKAIARRNGTDWTEFLETASDKVDDAWNSLKSSLSAELGIFILGGAVFLGYLYLQAATLKVVQTVRDELSPTAQAFADASLQNYQDRKVIPPSRRVDIKGHQILLNPVLMRRKSGPTTCSFVKVHAPNMDGTPLAKDKDSNDAAHNFDWFSAKDVCPAPK